jgi:hypothetical protein
MRSQSSALAAATDPAPMLPNPKPPFYMQLPCIPPSACTSFSRRQHLGKRTLWWRGQRSFECRYCCKSPKLSGDNSPATRRSDRRPPICVASITLPRSPVSLSSGDEVPHIFTRKSRLKPGEFLITSAKGLLQQNLPIADSCTATNDVHRLQ